MSTNRRKCLELNVRKNVANVIVEEDEENENLCRKLNEPLSYIKGEQLSPNKNSFKMNNSLNKMINRSVCSSKMSNDGIRRILNNSIMFFPKSNLLLNLNKSSSIHNKISTAKLFKEFIMKQNKQILKGNASLDLNMSNSNLSSLKYFKASRNSNNLTDSLSKDIIKHFNTPVRHALNASSLIKDSKTKNHALRNSVLTNKKMTIHKHGLIRKFNRTKSYQDSYLKVNITNYKVIKLIPKLQYPILIPLKLNCESVKMYCEIEPSLEVLKG